MNSLILDVIPVGRNNAIPGCKISSLVGISIKRLQAQIAVLRESGYPICAADIKKPKGYFIPATAQEAEEFCKETIKRAKKTFSTVRNVVSAIDKRFRLNLQQELNLR